MLKLFLATNNRDKIIEIQALLQREDIILTIPADLGLDLQVEENGQSYSENAAHKAAAFGKASGLVSLADDSGLEVDALGGLPGVRSRRFSPKAGATDADRRLYLLERLTEKPRPWSAHFHCTVAVYTPSGETFFAEGNCYGEIIPEERGSHGFGYDPIFFLPELNQTMAELSLEQKNRLSHRALAIQSVLSILKRYL
jgi:XTP/dITP diphosphohydrolase